MKKLIISILFIASTILPISAHSAIRSVMGGALDGTVNPNTQTCFADSGWTIGVSAENNSWSSVAFGNDIYVAVAESGTNRIMTSPDGVAWTARAAPGGSVLWRGLTFGNDTFVAVGERVGSTSNVMTSTDGISWLLRSSAFNSPINAVTFGNGVFVAVAGSVSVNTQVMTSPNGITWTAGVSATNRTWLGVEFGNNLFVAISNGGPANNVMNSTDGLNWTSATGATGDNWNAIAFGDGIFAVTETSGGGPHIMTSSNGINWTTRVNNIQPQGIAFGNGFFISLGLGSATSPDGIEDWISRPVPVSLSWTDVAFGDDNVVAVANNGSGNRVMTCP